LNHACGVTEPKDAAYAVTSIEPKIWPLRINDLKILKVVINDTSARALYGYWYKIDP
jgi:hypothetical protein